MVWTVTEVHTHDLAFDGAIMTKRYTSWSRGEHVREWEMLRHIHRYAPDLVPRPISEDLDGDPPTVTMSVVGGEPLGGALTGAQLEALVAAIAQLWRVPVDGLDQTLRSSLPFARRLTDGPRPAGGIEAAAYDAAVSWWDGPDPALLEAVPSETVIGHGDPNLANYMWDGRVVRIVDFEDAGVSDPATELAIMVEHLSTRAIDADSLIDCFDVDYIRVRPARRAWAMFWMRLLLPGGPSAKRNPPDAVRVQAARLLELLAA